MRSERASSAPRRAREREALRASMTPAIVCMKSGPAPSSALKDGTLLKAHMMPVL
jgi:hypothetical protein